MTVTGNWYKRGSRGSRDQLRLISQKSAEILCFEEFLALFGSGWNDPRRPRSPRK